MYKFSHLAFRWITVCFFLLAVLAQATDAPNAVKSKHDISKPLGENYIANPHVDNEQSRLVLFRSLSAQPAGVISVYLDEKYHVSLQPNAYSVFCIESNTAEIRTRLTLSNVDQKPELDTRYQVTFKKAGSQFVRVIEQDDGRTRLEEVPTRIANEELKGARQQVHTHSRAVVVRPCKDAQQVKQMFDPNVITFGSDIIFELNKTDLSSLSSDSQESLNHVVDKINKKYAHASQVKVHLVGYADEGLDESSNARIALARVGTVQAFLMANGLRKTELTYEWRSSKGNEKESSFYLFERRVAVEVKVITLY
jgi:outer membrane protein OmpA-like peptidoglycan-associated protein